MLATTTGEQRRILLYTAATLSMMAALLHTAVMPAHFEAWWGYGLYFMIVALAQAFYTVPLMCCPRPWVLTLGMAGNLALVSFYVVTRTVGVPFFGPHAWHVEAVGGIDLASNVAELALVIALAALLRGWWEPKRAGEAPQGAVNRPTVYIGRSAA